jgi:uncharacterized SAM-binding protein YcdF (DUF218 family)
MTAGSASAVLEPVALITWVLVVSLIIFYRRREWVGLWVALVVLVIHFTFASPLVANLILAALEDIDTDTSSCNTAAESLPIVVLAGGVKINSSGPEQVESLHLASFRRAVAAARLANESQESLLVVSGGSGGVVKEADLMSSLITRFGVSQNRIIKESTSRNTYESAVWTRRIIENLGFKKIILVTSAIHTPRAAATFRKQKIELCTYPTDYRWVKPVLPGALLPQISSLQKSTDALHEIGGLLWYRIKGWL